MLNRMHAPPPRVAVFSPSPVLTVTHVHEAACRQVEHRVAGARVEQGVGRDLH